MLSQINISQVKDCNWHHHTVSCRKGLKRCRYFAPWFPSEETIIAKPCSDNEAKKKAEVDLRKVRDVLEDKEQMALIWDLCPEKGESREDYVANRKARIILLCQAAEVPYEDYKKHLR